jgi:hypothetical protein
MGRLDHGLTGDERRIRVSRHGPSQRLIDLVQEPISRLTAAIAVRSSVTCVDSSTVVVAIRGLSVKLALAENVAETVAAALSVTVHVPVPEQPPLQPVKVEPAAGVAVKATAVPLANEAGSVLQVYGKALTALRSSCTWAAFGMVWPTMSVGSV